MTRHQVVEVRALFIQGAASRYHHAL